MWLSCLTVTGPGCKHQMSMQQDCRCLHPSAKFLVIHEGFRFLRMPAYGSRLPRVQNGTAQLVTQEGTEQTVAVSQAAAPSWVPALDSHVYFNLGAGPGAPP